MKIVKLLGFILLMAGLSICELHSQIPLRDIYGNPMDTPSWPPPDSLYDHYTITVWFQDNAINKEFLCNYWYFYHNPPIVEKEKKEKLLGLTGAWGSGCYSIDSNIITKPDIINVLQSLTATKMCQYSSFSPCEDSLSITRTGDTIPTPYFWNSFYITLDSACAAQAVTTLNILYGGTSIRFAELNGFIKQDATPNDPEFPNARNYHSGMLYEGVDAAWDIEHGNRNVKVAVIDDGIRYNNSVSAWDLYSEGTGLGGTNRVVDGAEYNYPNPRVQPVPNATGTNGGGHGTPCAGLISAMVNNNLQVSGVAGGWNVNEGISLVDIKILERTDQFGNKYFITKDIVDGWIDAAANTTGGRGFAVNIISNSNGGPYSEESREALDYAYRMGVFCFGSTGNHGIIEVHEPATSDYYKICAVGAYGLERDATDTSWVPTYQIESFDGGISYHYCSNYGYGLDLLGQGDNAIDWYTLTNQTLQCDPPGTRYFSFTSAACPQVAGTASLMLSNYLYKPHTNIDGMAFEDVQGLLCISAMDLNYNYLDKTRNDQPTQDTAGYDAKTGYGMLKADRALQYMQQPYQLRYFKDSVGSAVGNATRLDLFVVLSTNDGYQPYLPPTSQTTQYYADRYKVQKTIQISGWDVARSWSRSGRSTVGWSGVQPSDPATNSSGIYQTGYCRVVGEGIPNDPNFNFNNIRDISYRNDRLILETYCYQVYNKKTNQYLGWYPCSPEKVVYQYTIWGIKTGTNVEEETKNQTPENSINVYCEQKPLLGYPYLLIHYSMQQPSPATIQIFDILGNLVYTGKRDVWTEEHEQTFSVNMDNYPAGAYFIIIRTNNAAGFAKTILIK